MDKKRKQILVFTLKHSSKGFCLAFWYDTQLLFQCNFNYTNNIFMPYSFFFLMILYVSLLWLLWMVHDWKGSPIYLNSILLLWFICHHQLESQLGSVKSSKPFPPKPKELGRWNVKWMFWCAVCSVQCVV